VEGPRRKRLGSGRLVLLLVVLGLIASVIAGGVYYEWATGASGQQKPLVLTIPSGATGAEVAALLKKEGVIRSALAFKVLAKLRHASSDFQAGKYRLRTNMTISAVLAALKQGPFVETVRATFPEGLTVKEMASRAHDQLGIKASDFVKSATSGKWKLAPYLPAGTKTVEGLLYPSTYDFFKGASADDVIQRLLTQFKTEATALPWSNAKALGMSDYDIVTIASMIEAETKFDVDRPKVAAVIYNRLRKGMALEIDATIQYALGKTKPKLTYDDLKVKSPYNTYTHQGLPPTPITSPSLASLTAALNPAKADYLYYLTTDAAGHEKFTSSYQEFLQLKKKYLG
jgi:UPF0755 protein